jgi:hypothetical protein
MPFAGEVENGGGVSAKIQTLIPDSLRQRLKASLTKTLTESAGSAEKERNYKATGTLDICIAQKKRLFLPQLTVVTPLYTMLIRCTAVQEWAPAGSGGSVQQGHSTIR